jgi:hypothetical protein
MKHLADALIYYGWLLLAGPTHGWEGLPSWDHRKHLNIRRNHVPLIQPRDLMVC